MSTTLPSTPAGGTRFCGLCRCRLSRYNREDLCAGCSRDHRRQEPAECTVPTGVWQLPDVRQALVNREFGRMCLLIRQHGGVRQDDIAAITGLSQAFLSMLESGARKLTNIDKIIQLLDGLQAPPELTGPMLRPSIHYQPRCSTPTALSRC
ncbi:helix-turn-helix domain-containing protein [Streptomyces sp. NPDC003032]